VDEQLAHIQAVSLKFIFTPISAMKVQSLHVDAVECNYLRIFRSETVGDCHRTDIPTIGERTDRRSISAPNNIFHLNVSPQPPELGLCKTTGVAHDKFLLFITRQDKPSLIGSNNGPSRPEPASAGKNSGQGKQKFRHRMGIFRHLR